MDKTGIIVVSICAALLALWFVEQQKQEALRRQELATNQVARPILPTAPSLPEPSPSSFDTNIAEQTLALTNGRARYTFTSRGGGIESVDLLDQPETVSARWQANQARRNKNVVSLNARASVPILAVLGATNLIGNGNFTLTETDGVVVAEKNLSNGLRLVKEFRPGSNDLISASVRFENSSALPIHLPAQDIVVGTATPIDPDDTYFGTYGGLMWYDGVKSQTANLGYFSPATRFLFFFPRTPKTGYEAGMGNVSWAAAYNQYFVMLAMPQSPAHEVLGRPVDLAPFPGIEQATNATLDRGIQTSLVYPRQTLPPHSRVERQITLYTGPKEYRTLARIGEIFHNNADLTMNWGSGLMSFFGIGTFFAKLLLSAMNGLHDVTGMGYGWTIVVITVILRGLFWPLMAASMKSGRRMQALAPEIKALKEKYKDDPQKFTQKQWELFRKHKVNPMSGCLPAVVQMPVFFGFFTMLRSSIELRGAHFLWVTDLSKPDTLFMIPGLDFPLNLLPLLMVGVMVVQAHLQPPSPGADPSQQKMMRYFPLIMLLFLYNYQSGMALYMTVSTLMSVIQIRFTRLAPAQAQPPAPAPQKSKR
ncbi:MAG: membrane protein insertase YidC [Verrucomicrobiota bacterium]|nr:membrane protein insertase YidC [Verrucomicrobiota bacterium]